MIEPSSAPPTSLSSTPLPGGEVLFDALPAPAFVFSDRHRYERVNAAYGALLDEPRLGRRAFAEVHDRDFARELEAAVDRVLTDGRSFTRQLALDSRGPRPRVLELTFAPVGGGDRRGIATARDVTAEVLREDEHARKLHLHQRIFFGGPVVIFRWRNAPGWPVEYVSPNVGEVLGYDVDAWLKGGLTYGDLIGPECLERVQEEVRASTAAGLEHIQHRPYSLRNERGETIWVLDYTTVERDAQGNVTAFMGYIIDITHQREAELAMQQSEELLELAMRGGDIGLWDWNVTTSVTTVNPRMAEIVGLPAEATSHATADWAARLHPDDQAPMYAAMDAHLRGEAALFECELRLAHEHGGYVWVLSRGRVTERSEDRSVLRVTGTNIDITRLKKAEEALKGLARDAREANAAKSEFLANMSHEIRTPLNGVVGATGLLLDSALSHDQRQFAETARTSAEALLALINDILDFSKIEAGKMDLEMVVYRPSDLLREVRDLLAIRAEAQGLDLLVACASDVPAAVVGDPGRVRQVLLNLASNAVKFTREGRVELTATVDGERLLFEVTDTGIGIPEAQQRALFEPFAQADASMARRFGGTGLGLSISRRIAELHGGALTLESEVGVGSRFTLALPVQVAVAPSRPPAVATATQFHKMLRRRVLLVEDNPTNQMVARAMLQRFGHQVDVAASGQEALDAIGARPYDIVLMDLQMPGMDGLEATRRIREEQGRETPIVAMTAHATAHHRQQCLDAGMDDFLTKPIIAQELAATIERRAPTPRSTQAPGSMASRHSLLGPVASVPAPPVLDDEPAFDLQDLRERLMGDDELIQELLAHYLEDLPAMVLAVRQRHLAGVSAETSRAAHTLKGSSANIGARALSVLARFIEETARAGQPVGPAVEALAGEVTRFRGAVVKAFPASTLVAAASGTGG